MRVQISYKKTISAFETTDKDSTSLYILMSGNVNVKLDSYNYLIIDSHQITKRIFLPNH